MGSDQVPTVTVADIPPGTPGELFLLDVREPEEWAAGHIDGAAHIPMGELTGRLGEVPRSARVVAVCRSGNRSARVTAYLVGGGWDAHNLEGGMMAWAALGRPMTADTSVPPFVL
ncbi:rhodanese-like domain-containing protein [Pseudofrankia sp. BMG5.36]|uniref:rhodanese-like domain-containing protein n=1 Tax=Pseudofrankia sp. BMG5.36 TaxID=1834512 RepID=UPI0008DABE7B|nr:rhodanese-like domain-containing protein [Pseudofrankia sp. BMG5.36]OHV44345.1 sulfurtransferase [Pseudofrankia sp. BMG5.36]